MTSVVKPGYPQVLALESEFIMPQDRHQKQDCESVAAKRWAKEDGQTAHADEGVGKERRQRTYRFVNETFLTAETSPAQVTWV